MKNNEVHRKERYAINTPGHAHELTFSTYNRQQFFRDPLLARCVCENIFSAAKNANFKVWAFAIMPEHCHILIHPQDENYTISRILKSIKAPVARQSFELRPEIREKCRVPSEKRSDLFQFWQPGGGYDRNMWTSEALKASIDYIHNNPVKRNLCVTPEDWQWSSASAYLGGESEWPVDLFED